MVNNLPKPLVIGVVVVVVILSAFIVFRTLTSGGSADYGTRKQIMDLQKQGAAKMHGGHADTNGH